MNEPKAPQPFTKVNLDTIDEVRKGKEGRIGFAKPVSEALGRRPDSSDLNERHPFDVEVLRVPPRSVPYRYHSHSAQWEYYQVISGIGTVRHAGGEDRIEAGDAFLFKPGEPHQLRNDSDDDLVVLIVADNPVGESGYYPDEGMWLVTSPTRSYVVSK